MVAGGHRTEMPVNSVYSGVVTLTAGVRTVTFLAEFNKLELWATDIGNAYLESYTKAKVAFIAGPEFGEHEGHTFIIVKALYGLRSSGARCHNRLYDALLGLGFQPSLADADIWMREQDDRYEYIACYVDDLMIVSWKLEAAPNSFKLKGTGPVTFYLGNNFIRDEDGTLCMEPVMCIDRMTPQYERPCSEPNPKLHMSHHYRRMITPRTSHHRTTRRRWNSTVPVLDRSPLMDDIPGEI
jgi:hypothetical protein